MGANIGLDVAAIVGQAYDSARPAPWNGRAEVRLVAEDDVERGAYATSYPVERVTTVGHRINVSDQLPHTCEYEALRCRLPGGTVEMQNPMLEYGLADSYLSAVGLRVLHFYRRVREGAEAVFGPEMAVASAEMESAFARSAELGGARVELPFDEETDAERATLAALREKQGVDIMDVDRMIDVAFPKNYVQRGNRP